MKKNEIKIGHIVYVAPQPEWYFPMHEHPDAAELSFLTKGNGTIYFDTLSIPVKKGDLIIKNAGTTHAEKSAPEDPMEQICVELHDVNLNGLEINHIIPDHTDPVISFSEEYAVLKNAFEYLKDFSKVPGKEAVCRKLVEVVLEMINEKINRPKKNVVTGKAVKQDAVLEVKNYIDKNFYNKLSCRDLAEKFFISEGHLSRQFKTLTGYTLNQYIIEKRMGYARRMLIFTDNDIKDIAHSSGYHDLQYFYNVFRRSAGCTPTQFRKEYKK